MSLLFPERHTVRFSPADGMSVFEQATHKRITVVLSNRYVRYAVLPWHDALEGEAEEQAYLRHHFAKIHGERAKGWSFRWSEGLASAIDTALLLELKKKKRIVSIQPELMAAFNRARGKIPAQGAWLVLSEPERACVASYAKGRWLSVLNARGDWRALLERERHRAAPGAPEAVLHLGKEHVQ